LRQRDLPMNRVAVPNAGQLARTNKVEAEVSAGRDQPERCTQPFAPSVVSILWYRFCPAVIGRSTVAIASAPKAHQIATANG
jgi:hypothetical protein